MSIPCTVRFIVINVGTNNIDSDHPREICEGIMRIAHKLRKKSSNAKIIVTGLSPRDLYWSERRKKIIDVNHQLKYCCENRKDIFFLEQDSNWITTTNQLNRKYYYKDFLHLLQAGNHKLALSICRFIATMNFLLQNTQQYHHHHQIGRASCRERV